MFSVLGFEHPQKIKNSERGSPFLCGIRTFHEIGPKRATPLGYYEKNDPP